jgi:GH24 family phage-related lysozyme (muramidase)/peptidoglycan hydrolase-like protein with peptidoglycan-binding domain
MDKTPTHDTLWTVRDAMTFLRGEKDRGTLEWKQLCLRLAARAYGYGFSNVKDLNRDGDSDVADYWAQANPAFKHLDDRHPPLGGLAIFGNPGRFGHIAVVVRSNGDDVLVLANDDTDRARPGRVRPLSLRTIENTLNLEYLGWAEPHFPLASPGNPRGLPAVDDPEKVFLRALFFGNTNSDSVRLLQRRLGAVLDNDLEITGKYDRATKRAVSTFQRRCCRFTGSGADGLLWDPETKSGGTATAALLFPAKRFLVRRGAVPDSDQRLLASADEQAKPVGTGLNLTAPAGARVDSDEPDPVKPTVDLRKLVPGMANHSVRQLRLRLNRVNGAGLADARQYDDATVAAVRAWQISIGDEQGADGVLGTRQFAKLFPLRKFKRLGGEPDHLTLSPKGEDFVIEFEGFSSKLYNDQAGHCTIGVGHLVHRGKCKTTEGGLEKGITKTRAKALMRTDARSKIDAVAANVKVPLTQEQFDALVSFTFNVGEGNFESSTLLKKLNDGDLDAVPRQLARWNKVTIGGKLVVSRGLSRRRGREGRLFSTGKYTA